MDEIILKNEITLLPIDDIKPNDYNPNYMPQSTLDDIADDIQRNGFYGAIIINKNKVIVDGEHRWRALKKLGAKQVPVILDGTLTNETSKILTLRLNREKGYLVPVETGNLLKNLTQTIPIDVLSEVTGIKMDEMTVLTNLTYDPDLQPEFTSGEVVNWSRIDSLVNTLCSKIKEAAQGQPLTIYTIARGGFIPARLVADRLGVDTINLLQDGESPDGIIIIDDIYDSGKTYRKFGKKALVFATLFKRKDAKIPPNVIYANETQGAEYVVFPWDRFEYKRTQAR